MKSILALCILLLTIASCQNNRQFENKDYSRITADSVSITGLTGDSVKLVKTAGLQFKVKSVEQSLKSVSLLAHQYGGIIEEQNFESPQTDKKELRLSTDSLLVVSTLAPQANIIVRLPSQNLESFLFDATALGYYTGSSHLKVDDRSLQYLQNALRQKARTETIEKSTPLKKSKGISFRAIDVKDEVIDQFISNKAIDADVAFSTVTLALSQNAIVQREMIANYQLDAYKLPFGVRLKDALSDGWDGFINFLLLIVQLWMFLFVGVLLFVVYKFYLRRKWSTTTL